MKICQLVFRGQLGQVYVTRYPLLNCTLGVYVGNLICPVKQKTKAKRFICWLVTTSLTSRSRGQQTFSGWYCHGRFFWFIWRFELRKNRLPTKIFLAPPTSSNFLHFLALSLVAMSQVHCNHRSYASPSLLMRHIINNMKIVEFLFGICLNINQSSGFVSNFSDHTFSKTQ